MSDDYIRRSSRDGIGSFVNTDYLRDCIIFKNYSRKNNNKNNIYHSRRNGVLCKIIY